MDPVVFDNIISELEKAIILAREIAKKLPKGREVSCAITKLDEAEMWAERITGPE